MTTLTRTRLFGAHILPTGTMALLATLLCGCVFQSLDFKSAAVETLSAPTPTNRLVIRNNVGDITVVADSNATGVTAQIEKIGKGVSQSEADAALGEISVTLAAHATEAGVLEGTVQHPRKMRQRAYEVKWVITAPPSVFVDIAGDVGTIVAEDFERGGQFKTDVGDITVRNFLGSVNAQSDVGDIDVSTTGQVTIRTDVGNIQAVASGGESQSVSLSTDVGTVSLRVDSRWTGDVTAQADVGRVAINGFDLAAGARSGKSRIEGRIGAGSGGSQMTIKTDVGDITITAESSEDLELSRQAQ